MSKANVKMRCEKCGKKKRSRHIILFKGKRLCSSCKPRIRLGNGFKKIDDVLNKVYEIKEYTYKDYIKSAPLYLPKCMIGKRFKIILCEEEI